MAGTDDLLEGIHELAEATPDFVRRALQAFVKGRILRFSEATQRYEGDKTQPDAQMRMRFGVYYYAEPVAPSAAQVGPESVAR